MSDYKLTFKEKKEQPKLIRIYHLESFEQYVEDCESIDNYKYVETIDYINRMLRRRECLSSLSL